MGLALFAASPARAQGVPTIALDTIPEVAQLLNLEEICEDTPIQLHWSTQVNRLQTYDFEIQYEDLQRTGTGNGTTTSTGTLVITDGEQISGPVQGTVQAGTRYLLQIKPSQILFDPSKIVACPDGTLLRVKEGDNQIRKIIVRVFGNAANPLDPNTSAAQTWQFKYDTIAPPAPSVTAVLALENSLEVQWTAPSITTDVQTYTVKYCPDIGSTELPTETSSVSGGSLPCDSPAEAGGISNSQTSFKIKDGLKNGVRAAVAVYSVDQFGNKGKLSNVAVGIPQEVTDFFELYQEQTGGAEDGGFCFIATAAYGSYAHPTVRVLRAFRDRVLLRVPGGSSFVDFYYQHSPPLAAWIAESPIARAWTRGALIPVALGAILTMVSPLLALGAIGAFMLRRKKRAASLLGLGLGLALFTADARATGIELHRPKSENPRFGFGFQFKGGPYLPSMGNGKDSFDLIFGTPNDAGTIITGATERPLFDVGIDIQLYRGFGTAGIGGSFGFMQWVGKSFYGTQGEGAKSPDTTVFNILPLTLEVFYRFDWIADRSLIPLVPYLRGGLAYDLWWVTTGTGDISRWTGKDKNNSGDDVTGRGGKLGLTGTAGLAFLLNTIDGDAARSLFDSTGIRGTYVFGEVQAWKVDGFGKSGFDFSDTTWNLGVYFEW